MPDGTSFDLTMSRSAPYCLKYSSKKGDQRFTGDNIVHTFLRWQNPQTMRAIKSFTEDEISTFCDIETRIAAYSIYPINDYLTEKNGVRFFLPLKGFVVDPVCHCAEEYADYKKLSCISLPPGRSGLKIFVRSRASWSSRGDRPRR